MSQTTSNTQAFINAQQYSNFILENLHDGMLPGTFYRNVSDFGSGSVLNIKTVGTRTIQDLAENVSVTYTPIDSNTITMVISEYVGDGLYVTDELREDGDQVEQLLAMSAQEQTRAIQEDFETKFLAQVAANQTANDRNVINSFEHRWVAGAANNVMSLDDFRKMGVSFDKANVPGAGRIAIVDPVVGATIEANFTASAAMSYNPHFEGIITEGFARDHKFVRNVLGWDVYTSNRLPKTTAAETIAGSTFGSVAAIPAGAVQNQFMCVADDNCKPVMAAWRRMPKAEAGRNMELRRDEMTVSARFGFGKQREDTVGIILTSATAID